MSEEIKLITTEDGSHSLYVPSLKETYHSFHGAVQESNHVFIKHGLSSFNQKNNLKRPIRVLEVGLGTGLNALLVAAWAFNEKIPVSMTSVEAFPLDKALTSGLNYTDFIDEKDASEWFNTIHASDWNEPAAIHENFSLKKIHGKIEDVPLEGYYEVVFFDAFAPNKQAELWEREILEKVFLCMVSTGVFVTYCAKGQLKRDLAAIGLVVETLPGPPGKKEMVRAIRP